MGGKAEGSGNHQVLGTPGPFSPCNRLEKALPFQINKRRIWQPLIIPKREVEEPHISLLSKSMGTREYLWDGYLKIGSCFCLLSPEEGRLMEVVVKGWRGDLKATCTPIIS